MMLKVSPACSVKPASNAKFPSKFALPLTTRVSHELAEAKRRALDAVARQQDLERLYTFSRAILLIDNTEPFPKQLVGKLADIFGLSAAVLYERRAEEFYRAGPLDFRRPQLPR